MPLTLPAAGLRPIGSGVLYVRRNGVFVTTGVGDAAATPTVLAVAVSTPSPAGSGGATVTPSTVALASVVPAVTVGTTGTTVDTFTGTNGAAWASPWITAAFDGSGLVEINGNRGRMRAGTGGISRAQYGTTSYTDFDVTVTLSRANPIVAQYSAIAFRGDSWNGNNDGMVNSYHVSLRGPDSAVQLTRVVDNGHTTLLDYSHTFTQGVDFTLRVRAVGSALKIKIWDAAGAEPGTWNVGEVTDATHAAGLIGLGTNHTASLSDIHWDDFAITDLAGSSSGTATPAIVALAVTVPAPSTSTGDTAVTVDAVAVTVDAVAVTVT